MARLPRAVVAGFPHHVTQRGNRRQETFFCQGDYALYRSLMAEWCGGCGVEVWAYCLMPNHVHLIAVPGSEAGLRRGIGEAHRRYSRAVNFRQGWRGHLWQGRFASFVMDEPHLLAAARYIERNPVRPGLVQRAEDWPWSSAPAHVRGRDDGWVRVGPLLERVADWACTWGECLARDEDGSIGDRLRLHERTGRPLGGGGFMRRVEAILGRRLSPGKPGRPPKEPKPSKP
jgi:putative transposase